MKANGRCLHMQKEQLDSKFPTLYFPAACEWAALRKVSGGSMWAPPAMPAPVAAPGRCDEQPATPYWNAHGRSKRKKAPFPDKRPPALIH